MMKPKGRPPIYNQAKVPIAFQLSIEAHEALKRCAAKHGISKNELLERLIRQFADITGIDNINSP